MFKVITAKDEVEIGLTDEELRSFGAGPDIDALATRADREMAVMVWNYHDDEVAAAPAP